MKEVRYIVVLFWNDVPYTLQTDDKVHYFWHHAATGYKKLAWAKKRAESLGREYLHDKVCVFKVDRGETLQRDDYAKWLEDNNRLMFNFKYN